MPCLLCVVAFLLPIHAGDAHSATPKGPFECVSTHVTLPDHHHEISLSPLF